MHVFQPMAPSLIEKPSKIYYQNISIRIQNLSSKLGGSLFYTTRLCLCYAGPGSTNKRGRQTRARNKLSTSQRFHSFPRATIIICPSIFHSLPFARGSPCDRSGCDASRKRTEKREYPQSPPWLSICGGRVRSYVADLRQTRLPRGSLPCGNIIIPQL